MGWCKPKSPPETVTCHECRCLMLKDEAHVVRVWSAVSFMRSGPRYYCRTDAPVYDEIRENYIREEHYYMRVEVNKEGSPVGYQIQSGETP